MTLRTIPSEPHGYTALDVILFGMLRILQLTVHPFGKLHGAASVKFERALNETVGNMVMGVVASNCVKKYDAVPRPRL